MSLSYDKKREIISKYGKNEFDSGSSEVQIALLTTRIQELTEHFKTNSKDHHSRRGLLMLVGQRRRMLNYLKRSNFESYVSLRESLGIRK